jgi:hypothetical protein
MPLVQVYVTAQARTIYNINLPTGLYQFRLLDFLYLDTTSASNSANRILVTASSDTWRIPYGNASKSNTLLLVNRSDNGRVSSMATFNFLAEVHNGQMDITLTGVTDAQFSWAILSFDVQHATSADNFFPLF